MLHASNVAHVQAESGTFVLPARSPYDRQMLREHVEMLVGRAPTLTLGVHGTRWIITRRTLAGSRCIACTKFLGRLSCSEGNSATATCINCAMQPGSNARMEGQDS